jgi:hypothetical protein
MTDREASRNGTAYRIATVSAEPAYRSTYTEEGPTEIKMTVAYVVRVEERRNYWVNQWYWLTSTDRGQDVRATRMGEIEGAFPADDQERWAQVRLMPRDIYRIVWPLLQADGLVPARIPPTMHLDVSAETAARFGGAYVWVVSTIDDQTRYTYWVDAQTGSVLETDKQDFSLATR